MISSALLYTYEKRSFFEIESEQLPQNRMGTLTIVEAIGKIMVFVTI